MHDLNVKEATVPELIRERRIDLRLAKEHYKEHYHELGTRC